MEPEHGMLARYRSGCKCDDCRAANAAAARSYNDSARERRRERRRAETDAEPGWAIELHHEASLHDVRAVSSRRRLAMALRRAAETIRDARGVVASPSAVTQLLFVAADELDATGRAGQDTEKDAAAYRGAMSHSSTARKTASPADP